MTMMRRMRAVLGDSWLICYLQVRFNVLRVLPKTGKALKSFQKF